MKRFVVVLALLLLALCSLVAAQNRTYTVEDLFKVRRVGDPGAKHPAKATSGETEQAPVPVPQTKAEGAVEGRGPISRHHACSFLRGQR